jgi:tetratricopeptide (TPR) repeat protein
MPRFSSVNGDSLSLVALAFLEDEVSGSNGSAQEFYRRALTKFKLGKNEEALEDVYRAINKSSENPDIVLLQAMVQYELGIMDKSKKSADLAESLGNESKELFLLKAKLNAAEGNQSLANDYLQNALLKAPYSGEVWLIKGKINSDFGQDQLAISDFKKAISLKPSYLEAYELLVNKYIKLELVDSALYYNEKAIAEFKTNIQLQENKGAILEQVGALDSALVVYNQVLAENPNRLDIETTVGNLYFKKKNYLKAFNLYESVLKKVPNSANLHYLAGLCQEKLGAYSKAQELYVIAQAKDSTDAKYNQAYLRVEYLMDRRIQNSIAERAKKEIKPKQEVLPQRKIFSVEPLEKKNRDKKRLKYDQCNPT